MDAEDLARTATIEARADRRAFADHHPSCGPVSDPPSEPEGPAPWADDDEVLDVSRAGIDLQVAVRASMHAG